MAFAPHHPEKDAVSFLGLNTQKRSIEFSQADSGSSGSACAVVTSGHPKQSGTAQGTGRTSSLSIVGFRYYTRRKSSFHHGENWKRGERSLWGHRGQKPSIPGSRFHLFWKFSHSKALTGLWSLWWNLKWGLKHQQTDDYLNYLSGSHKITCLRLKASFRPRAQQGALAGGHRYLVLPHTGPARVQTGWARGADRASIPWSNPLMLHQPPELIC